MLWKRKGARTKLRIDNAADEEICLDIHVSVHVIIYLMKRKAGKDGKPSKKTDVVVARILEMLRAGNYYVTAAKAAGIGYDTFHRWMVTDPEFERAVKEAEAIGETACLEKIDQASLDPRHWTATAWKMERRWPERWAMRDRSSQETASRKQSIYDTMPLPELEKKIIEYLGGRDGAGNHTHTQRTHDTAEADSSEDHDRED